MCARLVGGLDELLYEGSEGVVFIQVLIGELDHGLRGHLDVVWVVTMDEVEDEVVSPGHHAVLEDLFGLSGVEVVVRIGLLKSEAEPGFPGLEADAPLGAAVRAVKVREVVAEEVDLVLGEVVDELAIEGPALDLIATGELLEEGAVEDEAGFGLNGDGTSGEADLVELRSGDSRTGTFVGEGDDGEGAEVSAPD